MADDPGRAGDDDPKWSVMPFADRCWTKLDALPNMIEQLSRHSLIDVKLKVAGDLHVDQHHTTEDSALAFGQALAQALGDKGGIGRYGTAYAPMDEALVRVALDISGRPFIVWKVEVLAEEDRRARHRDRSSTGSTRSRRRRVSRCTSSTLSGANNHHICEACFKGFARALRQAVELDPRKGGAVPSTKGTLSG